LIEAHIVFSRSAINWIFLAIGLTALVFLIREVTLAELLHQLATFGLAFFIILAIEFSSNFISNFGWYYSFSPQHRPPYTRIFLTGMASMSVAGALPSGQAQEFLKANMLRGYAPSSEIVSSLLLYNYLHVLTTSFVVFLATLIPLFSTVFAPSLTYQVTAIAGLVLGGTAAIWILLRLGLLERLLNRLRRLPWTRLQPSDGTLDGARKVDARLKTFASEHPGDLVKAVVTLIAGRLLAWLEVFVIMWRLGLDDSMAAVCMVYATTSLANYMLMILPAREGFLEGSTYLIFEWIGFNPAAGLSLELIRRIRKICYQALGVLLTLLFVRSKGPLAVAPASEGKPAAPRD
jgi:hypothetical protein